MNGNPEPVFNVDKITAFEVIARPSLSLNLVTDKEKVTKSVTNVKHRYIDPLIEGGFLVMTRVLT